MFYEQFLKITDVFDDNLIKKIDFWLATLSDRRSEGITASYVASKFGISNAISKTILEFLLQEGILEKNYIIKCPTCNMTLNSIEDCTLENLIEHPELYCTYCDENVNISSDDIFISYKRIEKPDLSEDEIRKEILKKFKVSDEKGNFSLADSLTDNEFDFYNLLYKPDESAYNNLKEKFEKLDEKAGKTKKEIGDLLEDLAIDLFKQVKGINGTVRLKTYTNQFDCTCNCDFKFMIPTVYDYLAPYFLCECKNEKKSPSNTYFRKLSDILSSNEATLGIVFSRYKAGKEARETAREDYLSSINAKKKILLSFSDEDLRLIIENRENLLAYLAFKILELTTNAKNADFEMFKHTNGKVLSAD